MAKQSRKSSVPAAVKGEKREGKQLRHPAPTLPQHEFPLPYSRLLSIGDNAESKVPKEIAEELNRNNPNEAARILAKMVLDSTFESYQTESDYGHPEDPRAWTRLYALDTLALLKGLNSDTARELLALLYLNDDYDLSEFMPEVFANIGEPAIEALASLHLDSSAPTTPRVIAADSLTEIAEEHPEMRNRVIELMERAVANDEDSEIVGLSISNLLDLGSRESLPLIVQAFLEERVDEFVIQMADVEEHFDLERKAVRKHFDMDLLQSGELAFEPIDDENIFPDTGKAFFPALADGEEADSPEEERCEPYVAGEKIGRNDPCPCGSGKKYKKCHGA